jgi:hypothetical protein
MAKLLRGRTLAAAEQTRNEKVTSVNVLLLSMPDSFEHMPSLGSGCRMVP